MRSYITSAFLSGAFVIIGLLCEWVPAVLMNGIAAGVWAMISIDSFINDGGAR